jgi:hypothetical protein
MFGEQWRWKCQVLFRLWLPCKDGEGLIKMGRFCVVKQETLKVIPNTVRAVVLSKKEHG